MKIHLVRRRADDRARCGRTVPEDARTSAIEDTTCQTCLLQQSRLAQYILNRCNGRLVELTGRIPASVSGGKS